MENSGLHDDEDSPLRQGTYAWCVSLGWFCGTADAMLVNGLRSFSGPFDWNFSPKLSSVLQLINSDFSGFMERENLRRGDEKSPLVFYDNSFGFCYNHDIKTDLDSDYAEIRIKYKRRAERFLKAIKEPTCFFRIVADINEVHYINENRSYIESVIKKGNPSNTIVFFVLRGMDVPVWGKSFHLPICAWSEIDETTLFPRARLFDGNPELQNYMAGLLSLEMRRENFLFTIKKIMRESPASLFSLPVSIPGLTETLGAFFAGRDWHIWGSGTYGALTKEFFDRAGIVIRGFIDSSPEKQGKDIGGVSICRWEDAAGKAHAVFIAIKNKDTEAQIKELVGSTAPMVAVYGFSDLVSFIDGRLTAILFPPDKSGFRLPAGIVSERQSALAGDFLREYNV